MELSQKYALLNDYMSTDYPASRDPRSYIDLSKYENKTQVFTHGLIPIGSSMYSTLLPPDRLSSFYKNDHIFCKLPNFYEKSY